MSNKKSGKRTLLMSVVMSAPGPLILAMGLTVGRSSTQIADFIRRSFELLAIVVAYVVYNKTNKDGFVDVVKKQKLERMSNLVVGAAMCLGGAVMLLIVLFMENTDKGNVVPSLIIAILGVVANTLFFLKYTKLNRQEPNAIMAVQSRLYGAKALVDGCVTLALLSVALLPGSEVSQYLDFFGTIIVSIYLIYCGIKTVRGK